MIIETTIKAVVGIAVAAGGMLWVQMAWQRVFPAAIEGQDPVAGPCGCYGCCRTSCETTGVESAALAKQDQKLRQE